MLRGGADIRQEEVNDDNAGCVGGCLGGCLTVIGTVAVTLFQVLVALTVLAGRALAKGADLVAHWDLRRLQAKGGVPLEQTAPPFLSWVKAWAAMAGVVLVVVLAVSGVAALAQGNSTTNSSMSSAYVSSSPTAYSTYVTVEDTNTPETVSTPTPVPPTHTPSGPRIIAAGILGGTLDDFTAAYGPPVSVSGAGQSQFHFTTASGVAITICLCSTQNGTDGKGRADAVGVAPLDGSAWSSLAQRTAIVKGFMPPDAVYVRDITNDPTVGVLHVYRSAVLAATFPADVFTDSGGGGQLPPGTFTVSCDSPMGPGCELVTGS